MTDYKIVTTEHGSCDCGTTHNKHETLWNGFITKTAAEAELAQEQQTHSIKLKIQPE